MQAGIWASQGGRVGQRARRRDQVLHARRQLHRQVVEDRRDVGDRGQGDVGEGDRREGGRGEVGGADGRTVPAGVSTVPSRGGCSGVQRGSTSGRTPSTLFTMSVAEATVWAGSPVGTFRGLMALMAPPTVPWTGPGRTPAAAPATVMVANAVRVATAALAAVPIRRSCRTAWRGTLGASGFPFSNSVVRPPAAQARGRCLLLSPAGRLCRWRGPTSVRHPRRGRPAGGSEREPALGWRSARPGRTGRASLGEEVGPVEVVRVVPGEGEVFEHLVVVIVEMAQRGTPSRRELRAGRPGPAAAGP